MGFEMPVDVDYFDHPKTLQLIALVGNKEADIFPLRLWKWCAKYAPKGVVRGGAAAIETACKWRGTPGRLHKALIEAGFVDEDGITVHDWMKGIGRAILIYERKKQKQREKYDREKGILPEESGKTDGSIPPTLETLEGRLNSGGEGKDPRPPAPPVVVDPTDDEIIAAVRGHDPTFPADQIRTQITRAVRLGIPKATLYADVRALGARMKVWTIVDRYQYPGETKKGNGHAPTPPVKAERPPVLAERREDVQKRQDDARAKCDALLEDMDPDERNGWERDAEAAADRAGVTGSVPRNLFIKTELRKRVAKENGIEGL
jgi:hypothetical protein